MLKRPRKPRRSTTSTIRARELPNTGPGHGDPLRYLWRDEYRRGLEEGLKDRPCAILLAVTDDAGNRQVIVLPITHTPPQDQADGVEIPAATKHRLGLDHARSWIVLTEANRFTWPGPDLRPSRPGDAASVLYGHLPGSFFKAVRDKWLARAAARRRIVHRSS